jgi:long-chain acyl-CoA synthetase
MEKLWLKSYPAGVPTEIDAGQYGSIVALLEESFRKYRDAPAFVFMDKMMSYGAVDEHSKALGAYLQSLGLKPGDRVAMMMPNVPQYPVAIAAVLRAGFIAVNVNPLYTPRELAHQLKDAGAKAIIIIENFATTLQQVLPETPIKHIIVTGAGDMLGFPKSLIVNTVVRKVKKAVPAYSLPGAVKFNSALSQGRGKPLSTPMIKPEDPAVLQYTGGTTGIAKGAVLSNRAIIASLLAAEAWFVPAQKKKGISGAMTTVCALPLYHVFAFINCMLFSMRGGGLVVLIPNPRDLKATIAEMGKYKFHVFPAVNTLFNALANSSEFAKLDFSNVAVCVGGGMAVQEAVAKKWLAVTGCPLVEGYGLTETSSGIAANPTDSDAFSGTIGLPMPSVEIAILDDDGKPVALGQPGEIAIRGPQLMSGYWQRPDETAKVMTPDGFFKSGDVGVMDARGFTKIVDRKKDMILVSGFNVYPNEVEAVGAMHPGVMECAVIGVPDRAAGEAVMMFVVKKDPTLTKEQLQAFCAENLTGYKKPKYIEFRDELPKTNVGKILRRELRDAVMKDFKQAS